MPRRYPWTLLDIDPTSDQKVIRKAYAQKLKTTRPDEDPAGFQALLEARDVALQQSRHVFEHGDEADDDAVPEPERLTPEMAEASGFVGDRANSDMAYPAPDVSIDRGVVAMDAASARESDDDDEAGAVSEFLTLLEAVGKPDPWRNYAAQWGMVFDALELLSFEDYPRAMWLVLSRLLNDLRQQVGDIPDVSNGSLVFDAHEPRRLGVLAGVLRDFESRFGFLKNDTALLDYLDPEDAHDVINALTIAVGRTKAAEPRAVPEINVEPIEPDYVEAAWADDEKMRAYYFAARKVDGFPRAFSWLALLFPLPFTLYYKLYGVAAFVFAAAAGNAFVQILKRQGYGDDYTGFFIGIYFVLAFALAFNWRRIRIHALSRAVKKIADDADPDTVREQLGRWGRPSPIGMWCGVAALIAMSALRIYFR